jgi:hypothetical protein
VVYAWLSLGCDDGVGSATDAAIGDGRADAAVDSASDAGPVVLGACESPGDLSPDPLRLVQTVNLPGQGEGPIHMLDVERDPESGLWAMVGTGGLFIVEDTGSGYRLVGATGDLGAPFNRDASYHKIEMLGEGMLAISNRERGVSFVEFDGAGDPQLAAAVDLPNASGMGVVGDHLLVLTHLGSIVPFDITNPRAPVMGTAVPGLSNPWEMVVHGARAYVADNVAGVVPLDVTDPGSPVVGTAVATAGGAQDVTVVDETLLVAVGSSGIEAFDLSDPAAPLSLGTVDYGPAVVAVHGASGIAFGATHEDVMVVDVSDPSNMFVLGAEATDEWAMNVWTDGRIGVVAAWSNFEVYEWAVGALLPEVDPSPSALYFFSDATTAEVVVHNRGGGTLMLAGASIDDARFTVRADRTSVPPGQRATLRVDFADDGADVAATLCIATNDPDESVLLVPVARTNSTDTALGEPAPDFDLPTIDSDTERHRLSDALGHPVVLVYFATW